MFKMKFIIAILTILNLHCISRREMCHDNVGNGWVYKKCSMSAFFVFMSKGADLSKPEVRDVVNKTWGSFILYCGAYELEEDRCEKEPNYLPAMWYSNDIE